jgi:protein-tyrosine kinase
VPETKPVPAAKPAPEMKPAPVAAPAPVATPAPVPKPAPTPPVVQPSATAPESPAPAPRPSRVHPAPVIARPPAYGAPVAREVGGTPSHRRAFTGILEPSAAAEPGQIDDHLVSLLQPTSLAAEQYRTVRLHIETLHRERGLKLIAISSPSRGDGKTLSAINLAGALAQAPDAKVVLVEVDVRHPGVGQYLGLSAARGLSSFLLDQSTAVESVIERPNGVGFAVVVAGPASSMPYELLKSPRLTALFAALRERFDYVLVDTPPVLPFPDVGILRDLVDGFLLVVRANRTPREMVRDSVATIGQPRVLGVVFNDDERTAVEVNGDGAGWRSYLKPLGGARAA